MTKIYNKQSELEKRKELRRNINKAESIVWSIVRNRQISGYKFRRQYSVNAFVLDFYCAELKLAIEIDGESHFSENAKERDFKRQIMIESLGIKFLRFKNDEIYKNINAVQNKIIEMINYLKNN